MCARFYRLQELQKFYLRFKLQEALATLGPQYNIAPSEQALAIPATTEKRRAIAMTFGIVAPWRSDSLLVNMRAESVTEKPALRKYLRHQRCLIPADGFFEWRRREGRSVPFHFHRADGETFGLAGVRDGESFAVLTTEPNTVVAAVHNRMPVLLRPEDEDIWLDAGVTELHKLSPLLAPYPAALLVAAELSPLANNPRNKSPEILHSPTKVTPSALERSNQGELFPI